MRTWKPTSLLLVGLVSLSGHESLGMSGTLTVSGS